MNATVTTTPASTTKEPQKSGESNFRSEVYKLHANSLILLHAQRSRTGVGSKKSQLNLKSANTGINYHIRKKTNETVNAVQDNEKHLEAKLGDLPQVRQKRAKNENKDLSAVISSNNFAGNKSNDASASLCNPTNLTESVGCQQTSTRQHRRHHHHHSHKHDRKRQWRSIIQGEDIYGEDVKKTKVYPEKFPDRRVNKSSDVVKRDVTPLIRSRNLVQNALLITPNENLKRHNRLKRALSLMGAVLDENPLYDSQNSEENTLGDSSSSKKDEKISPLSVAPPIVLPIRNARVKSNSGDVHMKFEGRSFDIKEPNSDMFEEMPPIQPIQTIDEDFSIPPIGGIPPIGQGNTRDDIEDDEPGDKRNRVSLERLEENNIEDRMEKIDPVQRIAVPTPIPDLSTISSIPDITDIPTLKSIPAPEKNKRSIDLYR